MSFNDQFSEYNYRQTTEKMTSGEVENKFNHSLPTLETSDAAMLTWVKDLKIFVEGITGWEQVPVLWADMEKAYQIKHDAELRDRSGTLKYPLIEVGRTGFKHSSDDKGVYWANIPAIQDFYGGVIPVARRIKPLKSSEFANAMAMRGQGVINYKFSHINKEQWEIDEEAKDPDHVVAYDELGGKIPIYTHEYDMIPIPVYLSIDYEIKLTANKQNQLNSLVTPFLTFLQMNHGNYFTISSDGWHFESFLGEDISITKTGNEQNDEERKFEHTITVKVLGYIIGDDKNKITQNIIKREGTTQIKIGSDYNWDGETK